MQRRRQIVVLSVSLLGFVACEQGSSHSFRLPTSTTTPTGVPATATPPVIREIVVGETITGDGRYSTPCTTVNGFPIPCSYYGFTAPASGSFVATLTWDLNATGNILLLRIEATNFLAQPPAWSPVQGRLAVVAGQHYQFEVGLNGSDFPNEGPYTLTTAIE
jgi:hypothetical protein